MNAAAMKFTPLIENDWHAPQEGSAPTVRAHQWLTLAQWQAVKSQWPADLPVGLRLDNTADVEGLEEDLPRLSRIALHFPKWTDGRAYSQGHVLRQRLKYRGELLATGDIVVDMVLLLARTGFDAVQLREGQSEASARKALGIVTDFYQGDTRQPRPLFARIA
jgi:uncharacterized protein (DUF934 family)